MVSLGEVGDALTSAIDKIGDAISAAHDAADLAEDAHELLQTAGAGSLQADVERSCAQFTKAVDGIREPEGLTSGLGTIADAIQGIVRRLELDRGAPGAPAPVRPTSPPPAPPSSNAPKPGSSEHIQNIRGQLPPPVMPGTGQRTHGQWFANDSGDTSAMVSGQGPESAKAWEMLQATDFPENGPPVSTTHVETKVAVAMREQGIRHATVVLNNVPCRDRYGCDTVVPVLLPEGSTLTVHAPNYRKTYTGGMQAPWQR